jgi:urease accessory protein
LSIELGEALDAYLHAFVANLVSAGARLIPLGQSDGLRAVAALGEAAAAEPLCRIGGFASRSDIASFRHETQHTRLFGSCASRFFLPSPPSSPPLPAA